jgi:carbon-monoxide dehydrogenase small subunit
VSVTVNGRAYQRRVPARMTAADFLRDELELTGTHVGCEQGVCGACTVLVDGRSTRSCILLAAQLDGAEVTTVEGLEPKPGELHPLQRAFLDRHGLQCGFCTPGVLLTAHEFLSCTHHPSEEDIRDTMSGTLCRCTGYRGIVEAIKQADGTWAR